MIDFDFQDAELGVAEDEETEDDVDIALLRKIRALAAKGEGAGFSIFLLIELVLENEKLVAEKNY